MLVDVSKKGEKEMVKMEDNVWDVWPQDPIVA